LAVSFVVDQSGYFLLFTRSLDGCFEANVTWAVHDVAVLR